MELDSLFGIPFAIEVTREGIRLAQSLPRNSYDFSLAVNGEARKDRVFNLQVILGWSIEGLISPLRQNGEGLYRKDE